MTVTLKQLKTRIGQYITWMENICPKSGRGTEFRGILTEVRGKNIQVSIGEATEWKWFPFMKQIEITKEQPQ